jgi:hypothetical protein
MICPECGDARAEDFVFRVLCPNDKCKNYDAKLGKQEEERLEQVWEYLAKIAKKNKKKKDDGELKISWNPLSDDDDFWFPQPANGDIEILPLPDGSFPG